jgi:hypothetical protein
MVVVRESASGWETQLLIPGVESVHQTARGVRRVSSLALLFQYLRRVHCAFGVVVAGLKQLFCGQSQNHIETRLR